MNKFANSFVLSALMLKIEKLNDASTQTNIELCCDAAPTASFMNNNALYVQCIVNSNKVVFKNATKSKTFYLYMRNKRNNTPIDNRQYDWTIPSSVEIGEDDNGKFKCLSKKHWTDFSEFKLDFPDGKSRRDSAIACADHILNILIGEAKKEGFSL